MRGSWTVAKVDHFLTVRTGPTFVRDARWWERTNQLLDQRLQLTGPCR